MQNNYRASNNTNRVSRDTPKMPIDLIKRLEKRNTERKSNWSRKKSKRKMSKDFDFRDKKTQLKLRERRMKYRVNSAGSERRQSPGLLMLRGLNPRLVRRVRKQRSQKVVRCQTKEEKMELYRRMKNYGRTKKVETKAKVQPKTQEKKQEATEKREKIIAIEMRLGSSNFDSIIKAAYLCQNSFDLAFNSLSNSTEPTFITRELQKIFKQADDTNRLIKSLVVLRVRKSMELLKKARKEEIEKIIDGILKVEAKIEEMTKDKKTPKSFISKFKCSKMKIVEMELKSLIKKHVSEKDLEVKLAEFFCIYNLTVTEFKEYKLREDKNSLVLQYLNTQANMETERENSNFKGDLREILDHCQQTEFLLNFSSGFIKESLSKIRLVKNTGSISKFTPTINQAWFGLMNISKLLGFPKTSKIGKLISEGNNPLIIASWILEAKKIYLDAYYKPTDTMSLQKWNDWMSGKEKIPSNFFEMVTKFLKEKPDIEKRQMAHAYIATLLSKSEIFFFADSSSRKIYELFPNSIDFSDSKIFREIFNKICSRRGDITNFVKFMIENSHKSRDYVLVIRNLKNQLYKLQTKPKPFGKFLTDIVTFAFKNNYYNIEFSTILEALAKNGSTLPISLLVGKIKQMILENKNINGVRQAETTLYRFTWMTKTLQRIFENKDIMQSSVDEKEFLVMMNGAEKLEKAISFDSGKNRILLKAGISDLAKFKKLFDCFFLVCTTGPYVPTNRIKFSDGFSKRCLQIILGTILCENKIDQDIHMSEFYQYYRGSIAAMKEFGVIVKIETLA